MKKYYPDSRRREISYMQYKEEGLTGLVTCCIGTAFKTTSLQERYKK